MAALSDLYLDIGGRNLHVVKSGRHRGPAVVLEAGAGCGSEIWRTVQEMAGGFAVTYSYDRAGHGSSDPVDDPWSLENWLADLEAWLSAGRVAPPYLLVGHSLGGHIVRAFAARRPAEVVGMILVDARHEDLFPELPGSFLARLAELAPDDAGRAGRADAIVRALPALDDLPLAVITHGRADWISEAFGLGQGDLDRAEAAWQQYQRKLAARSPRSTFCVAEASGHLIPVEQPELVVREIHSLIAQR